MTEKKLSPNSVNSAKCGLCHFYIHILYILYICQKYSKSKTAESAKKNYVHLSPTPACWCRGRLVVLLPLSSFSLLSSSPPAGVGGELEVRVVEGGGQMPTLLPRFLHSPVHLPAGGGVAHPNLCRLSLARCCQRPTLHAKCPSEADKSTSRKA